MYPFSMSTDEHVPLQHVDRWACTPKHERRKDTFQGWVNIFLQEGTNVAKFDCHHSKPGKQPFYQKIWWENVKLQNAGAALAPLLTPMPLKLLMTKRLRKITKIYLPICICCDRKSRAAWAQSFALWQQATIRVHMTWPLSGYASHNVQSFTR